MAFSFAACAGETEDKGNYQALEQYSQAIDDALEAKYSIKFTAVPPISVNDVDGNSIANVKFKAQEGEFKDIEFNTVLFVDEGKVYDDYLNHLAGIFFSDVLTDKYDANVTVLSDIDTVGFYDLQFDDSFTSYEQVLNSVEEYSINSYMFVEDDKLTDDEKAHINAFANSISKLDVNNTTIHVYYMSSVDYDDVVKNFYFNANRDKYFNDNTSNVQRVEIQLSNSNAEINYIND